MASPVFTDDTLILYHGDMTMMKTLIFDYVITDPPYNCSYKYPDYNDRMFHKDYVKMLSHLKDYKTIMIHYSEAFCGVIRDAIGIPDKLIQWVYNSNLGKQHRSIGWFNSHPDLTRVKQPYKNPTDKRVKKLIDNGSEGTRLYDWWNINLVKNVSKQKVSSFTNQIPIEVLERIILTTTNEGDTILDPFFGSGSLYFACKNTGRKCIGIEQSLKHIDSFYERKQTMNLQGNNNN